MTDTQPQNTPELSTKKPRWTSEKRAWWTVFGVLVLSIIVMLGAWN